MDDEGDGTSADWPIVKGLPVDVIKIDPRDGWEESGQLELSCALVVQLGRKTNTPNLYHCTDSSIHGGCFGLKTCINIDWPGWAHDTSRYLLAARQ